MRYDDASGAFQASGPIANDDADTLSAGERGPATGNLITGEGTQYGSAGADSAAGAHVTAIAGKGGEDTSFSGGKLHVAGEHGRLTVDAEGNYSYLANGNVENVRDRFTYTLADNQGNTDTAALIVEIGKTPAVIKADAQQIVPGPDGVVTLPPGVELSDVHVVGRNLVVDLPDGTQLIIVDGAIFVPQLVLGGVEVPATNVAALLIGQEVQPAAGEIPPSGGGNFALPPPPLDPGIPLGDLIPPTELTYIPPEPQEVLDILNREPEIFIQPDGQPASVAAVDEVEEAGLPTRNGGEPAGSGESADGNGADNDVTSETTGGTIIYNSPDGVASITLNGVAITSVGQVISGDFGDLTITSIAPGAIGYSYTLRDNTSGNDTHDDFEVILTDSDGDVASATLTIDIIDDVPTARPDTDAIAAGQYGPVTGNVITDASAGDAGDGDSGADTVGADNASITAVSSANVPANSDSSSPFVVNGQYGVLTLQADGNYSYVRNPGTPGGVNDVFNYTLTDGDGDTSTTTLTITIADATPLTGQNPTALLDDDALPGGIAGGVGDDPDAQNLAGNLAGSGGDGPLSFAFQLTGAPAGFTYVAGPGGSVLVQQGGVTVLTVTLNAATGAYTVTQNAPIDHAAGGDENNQGFTLNYTVTDQDGDSASGTLGINVDDDTPEMNRADVSLPTLTVDETNLALNASANYSVVFDGEFGADGPGTTSYTVSVVNGTDSGLVDVATGDPILLFMNGSVVEGRVGGAAGPVAFTVSVNSGTGVVTLDQIRALEHPLNPDNDEPVSAIADSVQLTATITDGDGDSDSLTVNIGHTLVFEDDGPSVNPTLNADATVTVDESLPSTAPAINTGAIVKGDDPDLAGGLALGQANSGAAIVDANAVFGADGPASANSVVYALSITNADPGVTLTDGTSITMQLVGGVIVGVVDAGPFAGQAAFAIAIDPATGVVSVEQYLSLDHPVNPDPNDPLGLGDNTVGVTVTATDGDGDPVTSAAVDISGQITFLDDGPSVSPTLNAQATVTVDESLPSTAPAINTGAIVKGDDPDLAGGLALGQANSGVAIVNANAVFGADGPAAGGGISYALSITNASSGVTLTDGSAINLQLVGGVIVGVVASGPFAGQAAFAIAIDPATGVVSVEQYLSLDHPVNPDPNDPLGLGDNTVGVTVTATDGDGDPVTSAAVDISNQITFLDDGPTVNPTLSTQGPAIVDESAPVANAVINTLGVVKGDDPDLAGGLAIGSGSTAGPVLNAGAVFGADGPAAGSSLSYALAVINPASGLTLTDGSAINLQLLANGVVVGVVASGAFAGQAAFAISINSATGVVSVEQYLSLDHPVNPDPNDALGLAPGSLGATVTATDGDGDSVTSPAVDISNQISFLDDGPDAAVNGQAPLDTLVLDETRPVGTEEDGDSSPAGLMTVQANFADNFVAPVNYGADGPGTTTYSFVLSGSNVASGLYAIDPTDVSAGDGDGIGRGAQIVLNQSGNTITGSAGGVDYFTITIDPATGVVTFTQLDNIWHANTGSDDDTSTLMANLGSLLVRQTVVDGDGDPDTADLDISQGVFQIEDDGPVAKNDVDDILSGGDTATGNVITGVGTNGGAANADDVGEDLPGRVSALVSVNEPGNTDQDPDPNVFEVDGEFGTLVLNADGSYTYTRFDGTPGNAQDVFTYTLIDADGDTETATLTINIGDAAPNLPDPALVRLDDDALAGGNPGGTGDDPDSAGLPGQLAGTGGDGDLDYNFTGLNTLPAGFTANPVDASTVQILQGATVVLTITLDNETGAFNVVQNNPIDHLAGDNENNYQFSVGVEVEDADGDVEPATITINVDDDTPVLSNVQAGAGVDVDETDAGSPAGFPISDTSAGAVISATQAFGADGPAAVNSVVYGLAITGGPASGLETAIGDFPITLVQVDGDTIQGQYNGSNVAFTIQMNANGTVTLTQNVPLEHDVDGAPGAPHNDTLDLTGLINATITITDGDGDTATASAPIGDNLVFFDDGPDAQVDGQATLDQLVLDETRPLGTETDGDSNPAGLATVQANFADNFVAPVDFGADGAGSVAYSLLLSANGIGSGLFALDPTDVSAGDGDGFGQGAEITLSQAGNTITGSAGGVDYFTITINPATGVVTFTQLANVWHADTANDDDTSSLMTAAASNIQVVQTVTDSDGDFDTASINIGQGVFHIEDDGPEFTAVDAVLNIDNDADPSGTGNMDFDLGSDGPSSNNNVISVSNFQVSVNGVALDPSDFSLTPGAETATTASYTFSFSYDTGSGGTATANGTLVFDKVNGSYTVDLDGPIEGFSILQTAAGTLFQGYEFGTSTPDGSQPEISVTQIQGTPGDPQPDDLFVQFTSVSEPSSGTGDDNLEVTNWVPGTDNPPPVDGGGDTSWSAGQLFNQDDGWVSTSNTANGVDGDTIQGGEVLDFSLVQGANPTGVLADPSTYGQASSMFLKFDGIGASEDMIVILKLYDTATDTYTTKAVMIQNADIQKGPGSGPGIYSGISLDNNDGLVIIEANDYQEGNANLVIVGAQIAGSDEGITGTAINLNSAIGDAGGSSGTQAFSTDVNNGPFKISSIGFVTESLQDQNATLDFDVTITEADGDSETTSVIVQIGDPVATLAAASSFETQSVSKTAANDEYSSLYAANDGQKYGGNALGNVGNTGITSAMVAASGLAAMSMTSLNSFSQPSFDSLVQDSFQQFSTRMVGRESADEDLASISFGNELGGSAVDAVDLSSSSFSFDDHSFGGGLDAMSFGDAEPAYVPSYAAGEPADVGVAAMAVNVPVVSMASAEMLRAAGLEGNVQHGGSVEQVLADALGESAPTIDGVLANLPGGIAELSAIANLASPDGASVPAWDMMGHGAFGHAADMLLKVEAVIVHQDAVQPA